MYFDILYHGATLIYSYVVFSVIIGGGYWFVHQFSELKPVANCDLDSVNASDYSNIVDNFKSIPLKTYDECLTIMKDAFGVMDKNNDMYVDKCENAQFLKGIGNTDEYALTYASSMSLPGAQEYCKVFVIDAFDTLAMEQDKDLFQAFLAQIAGAFPLNIFGICDGTEMDGDSGDGTKTQTCFDLFNFGINKKGAMSMKKETQ